MWRTGDKCEINMTYKILKELTKYKQKIIRTKLIDYLLFKYYIQWPLRKYI